MIEYRKKIILLILYAWIIGLAACATPGGITASNTPLNDKKIAENLGKVEGESDYCFAVLGIWTIGKPDIQKAIDNALAKKKADALINIKWYENWYYFVIFSISEVVVEGEAVKFQKPGEQYVDPY